MTPQDNMTLQTLIDHYLVKTLGGSPLARFLYSTTQYDYIFRNMSGNSPYKDAGLIFCKQHKDKSIEFHCDECTEPICIMCKVTLHDTYIIYISIK